jgi:acyl dehydratase
MHYFEDFHIGDTFDFGPLTVTEEEIITFARQFDPQYFHLDPERAKDSIYGGLIASGWHVGALFTRMFVDGLLNEMAGMGSPGLEQIRWVQPVRPNDTLHGSLTVIEVRTSASRPTMGILRVNCEMFNQHHELLMTIIGINFVERKKEH